MLQVINKQSNGWTAMFVSVYTDIIGKDTVVIGDVYN